MPFHRELYPDDWESISIFIRWRANWHCEFCSAEAGKPNPETGSIVVLTCAHLNHDKSSRDTGNLRSLCQACHLRYDAKLHAQHAADGRRMKRRAAGQLEFIP